VEMMTVVNTVTFSENVSGIDTNDFTLAASSGISGIISSASAASGTSVTVTVNEITGSGTLGLNLVDNDTILSDSGHVPLCGTGANNCNFTGETYDIDTVAPAVTSVSSTAADKAYKVGDIIPVTIFFDEAVIVTGTPQLILKTGASDAVADYIGGSGSETLTFDYTVEAGHTSSDLDYIFAAPLELNDGTIQDAAGNDALLALPTPGAPNSLSANRGIVIDTTGPDSPSVWGDSPTNNQKHTWNWGPMGGGNGIFRYQLDDENLEDAAETPKKYFTPETDMADGLYTLYVQERDDAGNWSLPGSFTIEVDTSAADPPLFSGTSPTTTSDTTPTWRWESGGGSGAYRYKLDNENLDTGAEETGDTSYTPESALSPEGLHTLYVQEDDGQGNWSSAGSFTFETDSGRPCSQAASPPSVNAETNPFVITYTADDLYEGGTCGDESPGSGLKKAELYVKAPCVL